MNHPLEFSFSDKSDPIIQTQTSLGRWEKIMKRIFVAALLLSFCSMGVCRDGPKPGQGFIDVPGGPVWYKVTGSGPGIPVLALHGGPGGRSCGFALLEPLAECEGAPGSRVVYEFMWGPQEFYATGTLVDFDVTDRLHEIDVPVLFMTGQFDQARPETVAGFQKLIPGSQFTVIEDAGLASLSKHPKEYRTILENFLESVENKEH